MASEHRGALNLHNGESVIETAEMRTGNTVMLTTYSEVHHGAKPSPMTTSFFDHVYANTADVATAAVLKPYARAVCSGTPTSIVCYQGMDASTPQRRGVFDRTVSHNIGMLLAEQVVAECLSKKLQAYIGFGVLNHREGTVVDVCGMTAMSSTLLAATPLAPSCSDGTLFPTMQEISVTTQKPSDVLRSAFAELTRLEDRALIPSNATSFLSLAVAVPVRLQEGSMVRMTRLHLIDVAHYSHLKLLARVGSDPTVTPWLQRPEESGAVPPHPLPLLAFGVGMQNRLVVHATLPSHLRTRPGAAASTHDASVSQPLSHVLSTLSKLRSICVGAESFTDGIGVPPVPPGEVVVWRALAEKMRLRRLANSIEAEAKKKDEAKMVEDRSATEDVRRQLSALLAVAVKDIVSPGGAALVSPIAGRATWECLRSRIQLTRETQLELMETSKRVEEHRRWLMSLPVVNQQGYSVMTDHTRTSLLEKSLMVLQEENKRQRALFSRDAELLQLEVAPMVEAAEAAAAAMPAAQRILQPSWASFCKELEPLLHKSKSPGHHEALHQAVRTFADSLDHDISLMTLEHNTNEGVGSMDSPPMNSSILQRNSTESVIKEYQASVIAAIGRALGLSGAGGELEGSTVWRDVVSKRLASTSDHSRVRHMAECLALQIQRLVGQTESLLHDLRSEQSSQAALPPTSAMHRQNETLMVVSRGSSRQTMRERVEAALQEEIQKFDETSRIAKISASHEPKLTLTVERLRALGQSAMDIALGYADGPVSDEPLTVSMMALLRDRLEHDRLKGAAVDDRSNDNSLQHINDMSAIATDGDPLVTSQSHDNTQSAKHSFPTLHVSLDDLLQGKRVARKNENTQLSSVPRRGGTVHQGFFSAHTTQQKQSRSAAPGTARWASSTPKPHFDASLL
ncbi:Hypothetical protein, putative [Bodo saltans]|uniref:Uncharacterized protein n=1 Tax=Bodo saltans TaxID=75058 RepID=A0A0S4JAA2_BODSA|nr:Hypothetical protein, putative [Bodo saltans]|eukprot:CUG88282.1 Hypothetical protein, putative [Bodo saltans]